ncbi:MAG: ABC transporter permease [Gordonia sp. (in: high G+C Gram-positive bacteria)]
MSGTATDIIGVNTVRPRLIRLRHTLPRFSVLILLGILIIIFGALRPAQFLSAANAQTIIYAQSVALVTVVAALAPLTVGDFDISTGGILGMSGVLFAAAAQSGIPFVAAALLGILGGLIVGGVNAFLVVRLGIDSFTSTLATATLTSAVALFVSGGIKLYEGVPAWFVSFGRTSILGIPVLFLIALILAAALWYVVDLTPFGRGIRATGSNRGAADLIGVRTARLRTIAFLAGSVLAAIAGLLTVAKVGSADPTVGIDQAFSAYAAIFLGATFSTLGRLNVWGSLVALITLSIGTTGLSMLGAPIWVPQALNGIALVAALIAGRLRTYRQR